MALGSGGVRKYSAVRIEIHGFPELRNTLTELGQTHGQSVERALAKRALRAMLKPVTASIKKAAPTHSRYRTTGKRKKRAAKLPIIKKSIGSRLQRNTRKQIWEAKAGLNVNRPPAKQFAQAHLYTIGTRQRTTRGGLNRGIMAGNDFVIKARERAQSSALREGLNAVREGLDYEVEKVMRRHAKRAAGKT